MNAPQQKKQRGRPSSFSHDEALDKALDIFWTHGYEGASLAELTATMGINRPSMYAAFGNKEALFRKALRKYLSGPAAYANEALEEPTARAIVKKFLTESVDMLAVPHNPRGCMLVQSALACGKESDLIKNELMAYRNNYEAALAQRFERAMQEGDLPLNTDPTNLAKYIATIHQGISVQANSGVSREALMALVDFVLAGWPGN
jgi:AcrR family transcriptional regulator